MKHTLEIRGTVKAINAEHQITIASSTADVKRLLLIVENGNCTLRVISNYYASLPTIVNFRITDEEKAIQYYNSI